MKISEYMNCLPTEKEKQEKWMRIVGKMMAQAENYFHSRKQNYKELITTLQNEFDGGNCPKENCRKAWIRIEFDNLFLAGIYFIPNCDCYIKCPVCKKWLYELQLNGYMQPNENGELKGIIDGIKSKQKREIEAEQLREKRQKNLVALQESISQKQKEQIIDSAKELDKKRKEFEA